MPGLNPTGRRWLAALAPALLAGCMAASPPALRPAADTIPPAPIGQPPMPAEQKQAVTILVSIDGFRADYLGRGVTPVLSRLAASGVSAAMRPSFPSITFPNHWAIVTGLRPDRNGIVANSMVDPRRPDEKFTMLSDDPFWWNEAEPIWVTAEKAGIRTATMFWPGANVAWGATEKGSHSRWIGGTRPEDWQQFNSAVTGPQRVAAVLDWLRRPAQIRPRFITLYFDTVDTAGHDFGPDDPRTVQATTDVDGQIGQLLDGLDALGQPANLIIVADHGMAAAPSTHTIAIDQIANPADYTVLADGADAAIYPVKGHEAALASALLAPHEHVQCWRAGDIPARFHYGSNPRVAPFFCLAEVGWIVERAAPTKVKNGGDHGYDNDAPEMRALFIAHGPAFAAPRRLPTFDNVDVAPLLRDLLGLPAGQGLDGDDAPFRGVMAGAH